MSKYSHPDAYSECDLDAKSYSYRHRDLYTESNRHPDYADSDTDPNLYVLSSSAISYVDTDVYVYSDSANRDPVPDVYVRTGGSYLRADRSAPNRDAHTDPEIKS
jgi:hypothetical protein